MLNLPKHARREPDSEAVAFVADGLRRGRSLRQVTSFRPPRSRAQVLEQAAQHGWVAAAIAAARLVETHGRLTDALPQLEAAGDGPGLRMALDLLAPFIAELRDEITHAPGEAFREFFARLVEQLAGLEGQRLALESLAVGRLVRVEEAGEEGLGLSLGSLTYLLKHRPEDVSNTLAAIAQADPNKPESLQGANAMNFIAQMLDAAAARAES
jgi:hypothetical protein